MQTVERDSAASAGMRESLSSPIYHAAHLLRVRQDGDQAPSLLVVIAGNVNYFYDRIGQRIADAVNNLGLEGRVATLRDLPPRPFDGCFLIGPGGIVAGHGNEVEALKTLASLRSRCRFLAAWNFESMATRWFGGTHQLLQRIDFDAFVDANIHRQDHLVPGEFQSRYRFVHFGLTRQEREQICRERNRPDAAQRPIPWATIGHVTDARINLTHRLVSEVDPSGFVYLPPLSPVTQDGPHLNQQQYEAVLRRSRYHVWCAHHGTFYMEGERYRASALTGGVPVKILHEPVPEGLDPPYANLLLPVEDFTSRLRAMDFSQVREQFLAEMLALPFLETELARFFREVPPLAAVAEPLDSRLPE